ncbi:MAG: hypothetical protein RLZZ597_3382 [Cyanobacteriota bacterium]
MMPSPAKPTPTPAPNSPGSGTDQSTPAQAKLAQAPLSQGQAEVILAELKIVKQRLLWVLIILGFFAARAIFFHY